MTQPNLTEAEKSHLRALATEAAAHSYSPYSHFRVGAAMLLETGETVSGCNVENASFRLTSCAEQAAVANLNDAASMPCGACRQTLTEFGPDETLILYPGENGEPCETTLGALIPHAFRAEYFAPKS
jgi:cytidine deaminase